MTPITAFWLYFFYLFLSVACGVVGAVLLIVRTALRRSANAR